MVGFIALAVGYIAVVLGLAVFAWSARTMGELAGQEGYGLARFAAWLAFAATGGLFMLALALIALGWFAGRNPLPG